MGALSGRAKIGIAAGVVAIVSLILLFQALAHKEKEFERTKERYREFTALMGEYEIINVRVGRERNKVNGFTAPGILDAMEKTVASLGLKSRLDSVKLGGRRTLSDMTEETAQVKLHDITLNELVNLLYEIERGKTGFFIKNFKMKKTFGAPDKLDVAMDVAYIKEAAVK